MISAVIDTKAFGRMVQEYRSGPDRSYSQADLARYVSEAIGDDTPCPLTADISCIERGCPQGITEMRRQKIETLANYMRVEVPTVKANGSIAGKNDRQSFFDEMAADANKKLNGVAETVKSDPETEALLRCCEALDSLDKLKYDQRDRIKNYIESRYFER